MKERPIIFNGPMVRAILEGRKTQTRRPIRFREADENCPWCYGHGFEYKDCGNELSGYDYRSPCRCRWPKKLYEMGDRLWVRETWRQAQNVSIDGIFPSMYRATCPEPERFKWCPSIHMPRWASRITLEVVKVRVEKVQEITEEDAIKEGFEIGHGLDDSSPFFAKTAFKQYWDSIYAKKGLRWDANPWIWVIELRKL